MGRIVKSIELKHKLAKGFEKVTLLKKTFTIWLKIALSEGKRLNMKSYEFYIKSLKRRLISSLYIYKCKSLIKKQAAALYQLF